MSLRLLLVFLVGLYWIGCNKPAPTPDEASSVSISAMVSNPSFVDVTDTAGLSGFSHIHGGFGEMWMPEIMSGGGGFVDYNGDHLPDILLIGGGSLPSRPAINHRAISLYKNNGDGTFEDVTVATGLADVRAYGHGFAAADYDNDGDADILVTTLEDNLFFENNAGVFSERGKLTGIQTESQWSTSALFFDADRDGDLDLYIASYLQWSPEEDLPCIDGGKRDYCNPRTYPGAPDQYFRNNSDGTFTDATVSAGFNDAAGSRASKGLGVAMLDYNDDGWPDLYVANDGEANFLFKNLGDGKFEEIGSISGVAVDQNGTPRAGMGVDAGVIDGTGKTTLVVGNFSSEMVGVWRYDSNDFFTDRANRSRVGFPTLNTLTFGLKLFDVDLDTDLDLMMANGHVMKYISEKQIGVTFEQPPQLFINAGDGSFSEVQSQADDIFSQPLVGRGLATADVDQDGDLDVLVTENNGPAHLWKNSGQSVGQGEGQNGQSLRVHLQGTDSNKDGIGTRIRASTGPQVMERYIRTGSSYQSQSELTATFGLGEAGQIDLLEVIWPSGHVDRFENVAGNQEILVTEGMDTFEKLWSTAGDATQ